MPVSRELGKLIRIYRRAIDAMRDGKRLTDEEYQILDALTEAMSYDRDAQELIDQIQAIMHKVGGDVGLIRECLLAKEFKTASIIATQLKEVG